MGQQCGCGRSNSGEEFIRMVLDDQRFKCNQYNFLDLMSIISEIKVNDTISRKQIDKIIPKLLDLSIEEDQITELHSRVFTHIKSKLNEVENMYKIIFYLFPFALHNDTNLTEIFFKIFFGFCNETNLKYGQFTNILGKYFDFCTWELNMIVMPKCTNLEVLENLINQNDTFFNPNNTKRLVTKILLEVWGTEIAENSIVDEKMFENLYAKYPFADYTQVRDLFFLKF